MNNCAQNKQTDKRDNWNTKWYFIDKQKGEKSGGVRVLPASGVVGQHLRHLRPLELQPLRHFQPQPQRDRGLRPGFAHRLGGGRGGV